VYAEDGEKFVVWLKTKPIDKMSLETMTLEQLQLHKERTRLKGGSFGSTSSTCVDNHSE